MKTWVLAIAMISLMSCARVNVRYSDDEGNHSITLPFSAIEAALAFSDEGELSFDDLAGVNESINLKALAKALSEDGDHVRIEMKQEDASIKAFKRGASFVVKVQEPEDNHRVTLNVPMAMMNLIAEAGDEPVAVSSLMRTIKKQKGVLLEVKSDDEHIRIMVK